MKPDSSLASFVHLTVAVRRVAKTSVRSFTNARSFVAEVDGIVLS